MSDKYEEIIKNKINNYMEQIKVPENLGGIIMEDFEKMKKEEGQPSKKEGGNNKPKNKNALKISIASVATVVLVGVGIFAGTKLVGEKLITLDKSGTQNSNMASDNKAQTIDEQKLEIAVKDEIIKLAKKEYSSNKSKNNTYGEGHIILRYEVKDNKLYAYVLTEYGVYSNNNTTTPSSDGSSSMPLTLIFKVSDLNEYTTAELKQPEDGASFYTSLKEMFPEDLLNSVDNLTNGTYTQEFNRQILEYIKANNEITTSDKLITDLFTYTGTTKGGNNSSISYKIPRININSDDVTTINNEISNTILNVAKENIENIKNGNGTSVYKINYEYYINSNILSLIIKSNCEGDVNTYMAYNIDTNTGKRIDNADLLELKEISKEEFANRLSVASGNKFEEKYLKNKQAGNYTTSEYNSEYNKTIAYSNCTPDDKLMYLDNNKALNVVTKIYSLAGASYYEEILNIDDIKIQNLTAEETTKLTTFLNNSVNNPFTQINYTSPEELFATTNSSDSYPLKYAVFNEKNDQYCSGLNSEQKSKLKVKYGSSVDEVSWYFINEENLINFFEEKMNYVYSKETLRKAFRYEEILNGYADCVSDTTYLKVSIQSAYKLGNRYYLTLKNSEKQINLTILEGNGSYYFYSCNY